MPRSARMPATATGCVMYGLTASAQLARMRGFGELERPLDRGQIGFRMAVTQSPHHGFQQRRPRP